MISNNLLKWYDENKRDLLWRKNPTPYWVWISEVMLQQTRVEAVKFHFERFVTEIPTVGALAEISDDRLMKLWEGLGYYSRAANLKKTARIIVEKFDGELPGDKDALLSLPGIGPYTAGAIASIAFGIPAPAADGNVFRVMARLTGNMGDVRSNSIKRELEQLVADQIPEERPGDFNQAIMELGAVVCIPNGRPKCETCPVQSFCTAYQQDLMDIIPFKSPIPVRRIEKRTVFVICYQDRTALRQRPNKGLLAGLWEFPNEEGWLLRAECKMHMEDRGILSEKITPFGSFKHVFTHLEWHMKGYLIQAGRAEGNGEFLWAKKDEVLDQYSIPSAFKAYLEKWKTWFAL